MSEAERKAAWEEYRHQITKDSTRYYNSLQSQLDTAGSSGNTAASLVQALNNGITSKPEMKMSIGAGELLTILSNTNRNVKDLIQNLTDKERLGRALMDYQRRGITPPPNLTLALVQNGKYITTLYPLIHDGVKRVNSALQMCHSGEIYLDPKMNQIVNGLRSELTKNLDILSKKPTSVVQSSVPNGRLLTGDLAPAGGGGMSQGVAQQQTNLLQAQQMAQAQAQVLQAQKRAMLASQPGPSGLPHK